MEVDGGQDGTTVELRRRLSLDGSGTGAGQGAAQTT
jgi:hypothetical protein